MDTNLLVQEATKGTIGKGRLYVIHVEERDICIARDCANNRTEKQIRCYNCKRIGNIARNCPKPPTGNPLN